MPMKMRILIADQELVSEHENMPAAVRHLDRLAARRGWLYSRRRIDARHWEGRLYRAQNDPNHVASYNIEKE